jgi:hypothetical protein
MIEMVDVTEVKALDGFRLWLRFSDCSEGVHDFRALVENGGPMVAPLRDPAVFAGVFISFGIPTWLNGFDVDAINLHMQLSERGLLRKSAA